MRTSTATTGFTDHVLVGLAAVAVGVAVLSYVNRPSRPVRPIGPRVGSVLGRMNTVSPAGARQAVSVAGSGRFTVILTFSPSCPYCEANAPLWSDLVGRLPDDIQVVAVSGGVRGIAQSWLRRHEVRVDALLVPASGDELVHWGIFGVPATIVVDHASRVVFAHVGVLKPTDVEEVVRDAT